MLKIMRSHLYLIDSQVTIKIMNDVVKIDEQENSVVDPDPHLKRPPGSGSRR